MGDVRLYAGCDLSYPDEKILSGTAHSLLDADVSDLTAVLAVNEGAVPKAGGSLPDDAFIRGNVPMTKEEIRTVSVSKMHLQRDSIIYDVGAGTGSVSVEMALQAADGMVYAVEMKEEAVSLIGQNARKMQVSNLKVIRGTAPEAFGELPAPTHAFIGGSGGHLKEIMAALLRKNPAVQVVINAVTLETVGQALDCIRSLGMTDDEVITLSVSRSREAGHSHMMMAGNTVYVISCRGNGEDAR